jgi:hypothetical protein
MPNNNGAPSNASTPFSAGKHDYTLHISTIAALGALFLFTISMMDNEANNT